MLQKFASPNSSKSRQLVILDGDSKISVILADRPRGFGLQTRGFGAQPQPLQPRVLAQRVGERRRARGPDAAVTSSEGSCDRREESPVSGNSGAVAEGAGCRGKGGKQF